ncbi:MAG TPA: hypothetical protein VJB39_03375, partial [Patescibacteria group bacterium]|nr:hypothetical protein [Patescibacteria group bacterium]
AQDYSGGKPIGYWKLDEGEGGTIYDWSGNDHHGSLSLNGSPATSTAWQSAAGCKLNRCLDFDGADDYADIGSTGLPVYSISLWFKADDITAHTDYLIDLNGTDYITVVNGTVTVNGFAGASTSVYVNGLKNGVMANTADWHHLAITSNTGQTASDLEIARLDNSYADGTIDEVKIFNYTLSPVQIRNEYNLGFGTYFK